MTIKNAKALANNEVKLEMRRTINSFERPCNYKQCPRRRLQETTENTNIRSSEEAIVLKEEDIVPKGEITITKEENTMDMTPYTTELNQEDPTDNRIVIELQEEDSIKDVEENKSSPSSTDETDVASLWKHSIHDLLKLYSIFEEVKKNGK